MAKKTSLAKLDEKTRRRQAEEEPCDFDVRVRCVEPPPPITNSQAPATPPAGTAFNSAPKVDRVHTSVYLPRDVWRRLRAIAAAEGCKAHDLVMEGLVEVVARRRAEASAQA